MPQSNIQNNIPYFKNLDALRFMAAFSVLIFHYFSWMNDHINFGSFYEYIDVIISKGSLGVNFFFVLSGFLISYLIFKEIEVKKKFHAFNFFVRRTLRIWPLYFFVIALTFFIINLFPIYGATNHNWTWYLFFGVNFDEIYRGVNDLYTQLTIPWSVSIEEQFYFFWAIVIGGLHLKSKNQFIVFFIIIWICSLIFRGYHDGNERVLYYHTFSVMGDLAIGAIIAWGYFFHLKYVKKIFSSSKAINILIYLIIAVAIILKNKLFNHSFIYIFENTIISLGFGWIILHQIIGKNYVQLHKHKFLTHLGKISYGIYMYHALILFFIEVYYFHTNEEVNVLWVLLFGFAGTIILSHLSYIYLEKPFLKLKRRFR